MDELMIMGPAPEAVPLGWDWVVGYYYSKVQPLVMLAVDLLF